MSKKKRKTRVQKEASTLKIRKDIVANETETINENDVETPQDRVKARKVKTVDWASDKINNDLKNVLIFIGMTLFLVAAIYILIHKTSLLNPLFNRFNISY